jgi:UDP-N-acetylglucosamine--N-acetylmuramyl-(pentapeptide) pyrophosphoryl-undecaprenol N-acetylglucosamine transferase
MSARPSLRVVIAGGGTGGHVFPGLAVARELLARDAGARVSFAGTAGGLEARLVPRAGFELDLIRSGALKGTSPTARLRGVALLPLSALDAWRLISRRAPHVVVGVGGYSSGPVVAVAAARGIPTLLLEQNAVPGLTNRLLAPFARSAAVTYEASLRCFKGGKAFVSGNPVRPEFLTIGDAPRDASRLRVLIVGGSQGAHAINLAVVEAAARLAAAAGRLDVTCQTGERDLALVREACRRSGLDARVEPFFEAMDREVSAAHMVVSRAGATTLAEITAAGRPAILIPLPTATDDHQRMNAEVLRQAGAAEVVDEAALTGSVLAERIVALADDPPRRAAMAAAARRLARPDAAGRIVDRVIELAESQR